jgi:RNA polymerase sigma-70 factor (ECF subfamily)
LELVKKTLEDQQILEQFGRTESRHRAFTCLVEKYQQQVYRLVRRMVIDHDDADDLVQEVFIKVYNNLDNFQGESQLFTWIYRIATNECLRFLEKKRRRYWLPIADVNSELTHKLENSQYVDGDEIQRKLQKAVLTLPDKQRAVFHMKYYENMKYETIAEITGTSIGSLKASYHHAVKKIEEILTNAE